MRFVISLLILLLLVLSPVYTVANDDSFPVKRGTVLEYKIIASSNLMGNPTRGDFEYYELIDFPDQLLVPNLSSSIQDEVGFRDFFSNPANSLIFKYSDSYSDTSDNIFVSPFFPGGIILVNDWQFMSNFGSIFEFTFQQDEHNKVLTYYSFSEDAWSIEINIASAEGEIHNTLSENYTIEVYNDYYLRYHKSSGILVDVLHEYSLTNYSQILETTPEGKTYASYHVARLSDSYLSKYLFNSQELFFPTDKNKKGRSVEWIIGYTLLITILSIFTYLTYRNRDKPRILVF